MTDEAASVAGVKRAVRSMATILAVLVLSGLIILTESISGGGQEVGARDLRWLQAANDLRPRRPIANEPLNDMRWPPASSGSYQITYLFTDEDIPQGRAAIIAGAVSGAAHIHVNGVRLSDGRSDGEALVGLAGMRSVFVPVDPRYFHPARNRIDIVVSGDRVRPVLGVLAFGAEEDLHPAFVRRQFLHRAARTGALILAGAAAAFCLLASLTALRPGTFLLAGSAAAAFGLALAATGIEGLAHLGQYAPPASMALTATAFFTLGLLLNSRVGARGIMRAAVPAGIAALVLGVSAFFALNIYPEAAWWLGIAAVLSASGPAVMTVAANVRAAAAGSIDLWTAALSGLAGVAVLVWFWAQSGLAAGGLLMGAERVYQAACMLLLTIAAAAGARHTFARAWSRLRDQLDSARMIERQRAQIETVSKALREAIEERAVLEERQRLVRDMHDGIGGQLMSMFTRVKARKVSLKQLEEELGAGLQDLRLVVDSLDSAGDSLASALRAFEARARPQAEAAGIELNWSQAEEGDVPLRDPQAILNVFRWMQEALTNVIRHSGASRLEVTVCLDGDAGELVISFADNGGGLGNAEEAAAGKGLANMRQRAQALSGRSDVRPGPSGMGVTVTLSAPLRMIVPPGAASTLHRADP